MLALPPLGNVLRTRLQALHIPSTPYSQERAEGVFSEVRRYGVLGSSSMNSSYGACIRAHEYGRVSACTGWQRRRTTSRRRWVLRRRGEPVVQPAAARTRRRLRL